MVAFEHFKIKDHFVILVIWNLLLLKVEAGHQVLHNRFLFEPQLILIFYNMGPLSREINLLFLGEEPVNWFIVFFINMS